MPNVIRLMEAAHAQKVGKVSNATSAFAPIICLVRRAYTLVNVTKITRRAVIRGRVNVIVKLAGAAIYAIDLAHS